MKKAVITLYAFYFFQGIIHNLGHPVTPTFVNMLGLNPRMFGFFFSFMSLGIMVGSPIWGVLGDRYPKKPLIITGLILYSVSQMGFVLFSNPYAMTFFRFVSGFGVSASITLILAIAIQITSGAGRVKVLSITAAMMALGATFGYQIGGQLGAFIIEEIFYIQAIANTVYAVFIGLFLKAPRTVNNSHYMTFTTQVKLAFQLPKPLIIFLLGLSLATIAATNISKYLDVYIIDSGYTTIQLGNFVFVTGIIGLFTNFFLVPFLTRFNQNIRIMRYLQLISAVVIVITFQIPSLRLALYTIFMVYVVMKSTFEPLEKHHISLNADDSTYASLMGVRQMFFSIGMVLGPIISGFIYEFNPLFVFYFSALMFVFAFVLISSSAKSSKVLLKEEIVPVNP
jgi:DHA1 family multidrug resistance protein-like MFS transporter